jgi:hypothetical protein
LGNMLGSGAIPFIDHGFHGLVSIEQCLVHMPFGWAASTTESFAFTLSVRLAHFLYCSPLLCCEILLWFDQAGSGGLICATVATNGRAAAAT